jgi:hypothetical protein
MVGQIFSAGVDAGLHKMKQSISFPSRSGESTSFQACAFGSVFVQASSTPSGDFLPSN